MMIMRVDIIVIFILLPWLAHCGLPASQNDKSYVRDACNITRYRNLCMHSLASYSNTAKRSPSKWARAGVSVTLVEAKSVAGYLTKLKQHRALRGRNQVALLDCIECLQDAVDNLHKSLGILRKLNGKPFGTEMGDLNTWMSAALTDQDTCLDGFVGENQKRIKQLRNRVLIVTHITSNALALVSRLAATGVGNLTDP